MKKVYLQALGCRLNEAELESWAQQYHQQGYGLCADPNDADLMVVNTCAVTNEASRKSRQLVNRLKQQNPQAQLLVSGCHSNLHPEQMQQAKVDLLVKNQNKDQLVQISVESLLQSASTPSPQPPFKETTNSLLERGRHRAFIKVQDGCRYRCTYCIVTLARGEERSRAVEAIIDEVQTLHRQGIQEVVITGVHVGGYGSDTNSSLFELLQALLQHTAIPRIRLASVEPWDLNPHFADLFSDTRLMPHMHLPLQSGSNSVLRRMSRRCRSEEFAQLCGQFQQRWPGFNVTTDIIVGFPGESETEWQQSLNFVKTLDLGHIHIFNFSAREGTKAASLPGQIHGAVKKERHQQLQEVADKLKSHKLQAAVGQRVEVLWESQSFQYQGQRYWSGLTPNFLRVIHADDGHNRENRIESVQLQQVDEAAGVLIASP